MATQTADAERLETNILGQDVSFVYSETWIGYSLLSLRLVMAYVFLSAGLEKLLDPGWSAAGFLTNAIPDGNPFAWLWPELAGMPLIDPLNVWGQILIGLALLFGVTFRLAAFSGALMMLFYWAASLGGGPLAGFPVENGYFVTYHMVYALLLFGLGAFGAGRILGIDAKLEESAIVQNNPWLRLLLG